MTVRLLHSDVHIVHHNALLASHGRHGCSTAPLRYVPFVNQCVGASMRVPWNISRVLAPRRFVLHIMALCQITQMVFHGRGRRHGSRFLWMTGRCPRALNAGQAGGLPATRLSRTAGVAFRIQGQRAPRIDAAAGLPCTRRQSATKNLGRAGVALVAGMGVPYRPDNHWVALRAGCRGRRPGGDCRRCARRAACHNAGSARHGHFSQRGTGRGDF